MEAAPQKARNAFNRGSLSRATIYTPEKKERTPEQLELIEAVREADGLVIATPSYHAGMSGLIKNAIDLLEDLRDDRRPYLDRRAVGCIVTAYGWQGGGTTLSSVRAIVHALRGWPTPLAVTLNTAEPLFDAEGTCTTRRRWAIAVLSNQVLSLPFACGLIPSTYLRFQSRRQFCNRWMLE